MNIILLSGGSGKRLWPLSNAVRSKQFIKIFKTDDGQYVSMVQQMCHQIEMLDKDAKVTIATSKDQISALKNQLGDHISISEEPCQKDTFPAIALAAMYLHDVQRVSEEEAVVVCPVDPFVDEAYFTELQKMACLAEQGKESLTLLGIEPTYPSEKYGYIVPKDGNKLSKVKEFKEKPNEEIAEKYIHQGALWNGGVFAFKLKYVIKKAHEMIDFKNYGDLYAKYDILEAISFDYAVAEKEKSIQVLRFSGKWKDLGTWNTLTEVMEENLIGNVMMDGTCENTHVINELDLPLICMGMKNTVVSASPEGILVSSKEQSSYIKPYVDKLQGEIMFAEKSWGTYRVLDVEEQSMTVKIILNAGHGMNYHSHERRNEVWTVICGEGHVIVDGMKQHVSSGDVITIQAGCRHTIIADTELHVMEVQLGKEISVDDKYKYKLDE